MNWCLLPVVSWRILNITWSENVTNYEVRRRTGQPLLSHTVRTRRLKLFGHVAQAEKSQDHSRALQSWISSTPRNWRRRPGRPRHTWLRTVLEDLRQFSLGLASWLRRAQNRTAWRTLTGTATSPTSSNWLIMWKVPLKIQLANLVISKCWVKWQPVDEVNAGLICIAAVLSKPLLACKTVPWSQDSVLWCRAISLLHSHRGWSAGCPSGRLLLKGCQLTSIFLSWKFIYSSLAFCWFSWTSSLKSLEQLIINYFM